MIVTLFNPFGIFVISMVLILGVNNIFMNDNLLTLTSPLIAFGTTTTTMSMSHSEHMDEMHHDSSNATMSEEDKMRFCGTDKVNSNLYVIEFAIPVQCSQPV